MPILSLTPKQRLAYYKYLRQRRLKLEERAKQLLGNKCDLCAKEENLRVQFRNLANPNRMKYQKNPVTLYRRLCLEATMRDEVMLLCSLCRLERKNNS
jgi:hypothetical protein